MLIRPQMEAKQLRFTPPPTGSGVRVRADVEKLQQILLNLRSNAAKFTEPSGSIRLECEVREQEVSVHVADAGCGIPREKLASVFDPFVQVDHGSTRSGEGTGLGLAIRRELAAGMGGRLEVRREIGTGSTFTVTLARSM